MSIHVSAIIHGKKGYARRLKPLLFDLVNESRSEKACLQYDLHQSLDDEDVFIIHEQWLEPLWLELHDRQDYVHKFHRACDAFIENQIVIYKSEQIA